jgi:hypothetical protein
MSRATPTIVRHSPRPTLIRLPMALAVLPQNRAAIVSLTTATASDARASEVVKSRPVRSGMRSVVR